jgi:hypothetical protein
MLNHKRIINYILWGKDKEEVRPYTPLKEHCPSCKMVVGSENNNCKYNNTRLHGKN